MTSNAGRTGKVTDMNDKVTALPITDDALKYASDRTGITITKETGTRPFLIHLTPEEIPQVIEKLVEYSQPWPPKAG